MTDAPGKGKLVARCTHCLAPINLSEERIQKILEEQKRG